MAIEDNEPKKSSELNLTSSSEIQFVSLMKLFFQQSPDLFCIISRADRHFSNLNPAWERLLGYSTDELMSKPYTDFLHPDDLNLTISLASKLYGGEEVTSFTNRFRCKNGEYKWLDWHGKASDDRKSVFAVARDVTEKKIAQDLSSQQMNMLQTVTDSVRDAIIMLDHNGQISFWNKAATTILGYNAEEVMGKNLHQIITPTRYRGEHKKKFPEFQSTGQGAAIDKTVELFAVHKNGTEFPIELSLSAIKIEGKWNSVGVMRDISERVKSEELLKLRETRLRSYFELPQVGITITSPDKGWLEVNSGIQNMLGYTLDEFNGLTWTDLTHPDDVDADLAQFKRVLDDEIDSYVLEKRFIRKNGEIVWTILSVVCVRKPDRSVDYFIALLQDITKRKVAENIVSSDRILLRTLIDNIPDTIYVKDIEGRKTLANVADLEVMGYESEADIFGKTDLELFSDDNSRSGFYEDMEVIKKGKPILNHEGFYTDKKGNSHWILTTKVPLYDEQKKITGLVGIGHDITNRKESRIKLENLAVELKEINQTKDKLFSIIAHDLRGPIGNFSLILDLLSDDKNLKETEREFLMQALKKGATNAYRLLENLLSWASSQSNKIDFKPSRFFINDLISNNVELLSPTASQKDIDITIKPFERLSVYADKDSIDLVLRNLLSNAIKFTNSNGLISVSGRLVDGFVEIQVADNGIGMNKELSGILFNSTSFYSSYGTNNERGSGLGLALCKDFVEKNGGHIRVESEVGRGSKFYFTLPAQ